jgi:hypothetical protein
VTKLTESAWFWVGLFSLVGIVLVWTTSSRAQGRWEQLVSRFYARQLSGHSVPNPDVAAGSPRAMSEAMGGRRVFVPIYVVLAALVTVSAIQLGRQHAVALARRAVNREMAKQADPARSDAGPGVHGGPDDRSDEPPRSG